MHLLDKGEALAFVRERAQVLDADAVLQGNPFARSDWLLPFIEHVGEADWTFRFPETRSDGDAFMLLYGQPGSRRASALANYYASLFSPVLGVAADRPRAIGELVGQLNDLRPRCTVLRISPLDERAPDTQAIAAALAASGWYVRRFFCFGNWHLPSAGRSYADYLAGLESKLRNTIARKAKKLRSGGGRVEIVTGESGLDRALDAFEQVYAKSWKTREPYPQFIRAWANACARNGWLRLGVAYVGEVPVAAQFWFTVDRRAYIFKLAYDEAHQQWSAGTVLTAALIEHSLEGDEVVEIDYLTGDDAYKQTWMTHRRERIGIIACNRRTLEGTAVACREFAGELRSRWRARAKAAGSAAQTGIAESPVRSAGAGPR